MMQLTPIFIDRIRATLAEGPLGEGDVRRMEGLGEHYVSIVELLGDQGLLYLHLFSVRIDGTEIHCYRRKPLQSYL